MYVKIKGFNTYSNGIIEAVFCSPTKQKKRKTEDSIPLVEQTKKDPKPKKVKVMNDSEDISIFEFEDININDSVSEMNDGQNRTREEQDVNKNTIVPLRETLNQNIGGDVPTKTIERTAKAVTDTIDIGKSFDRSMFG